MKRTSWLRVFVAFFLLVAFYVVCWYQSEVLRLARVLFIPHETIQSVNLKTPIDFGAAPNPDLAYVEMDLEFRPTDENGYPNLFQTSDINQGLRAELSGGIVGLVTSDKTLSGGMRGDTIVQNVELGKWYRMKLRALNHGFVHISVSGQQSYDTWSRNPDFSVDHIMLGCGFSPERQFRGDIRNARLTVGTSRSPAWSEVCLAVLKILLLGGFFLSILGFSKRENPAEVSGSTAVRFNDPLLILRAFACMLVVVGHGMIITHRPLNLIDNLQKGHADWMVTSSPWAGVWIFFVLSGYLMGKGFISGRYLPDQIGIWTFYKNRLLRIVPLYWVSVFIVSAILTPEIFLVENLQFLLHILFFDYDGQLAINPIGSLWSVGTEMQFYLLVPIAFIFARRWIASWLTIGVAFLTIIVWGLTFRTGMLNAYGFSIWPREVYKTIAGNIDLFLLGFVLNFIISRLKFEVKFGFSLGLALMGVGYLAISFVSAQGMLLEIPAWRGFLFGVCPTFVAIVTCLIIVCFELRRDCGNKFFAKIVNKIEIFGLMTYAIYVWHEPILLAAGRSSQPLTNAASSIKSLIAGCLITLIVSGIMYFFVEMPFDKKRKI
jgi:peptidoglycan/LPS O-acetylase OafA/YrhL